MNIKLSQDSTYCLLEILSNTDRFDLYKHIYNTDHKPLAKTLWTRELIHIIEINPADRDYLISLLDSIITSDLDFHTRAIHELIIEELKNNKVSRIYKFLLQN